MADRDWTVATLLDDMAARGDRAAVVALSDRGRDVCAYGALARRALALAAGLAAAGARPGERVYLAGAAGIDWIAVYLGALAAGLVVVPLDPLGGAGEIARVAAAAPPAWAFADGDLLDAARAVAPPARCYRIGAAGPADTPAPVLAASVGDAGAPPPPDPAAPALLLQTSGTTGAPKLFTLSGANLAANIVPLAGAGLVRPGDRLVLPLPLHHVYPQVVGVLASLVAGATIVLPAAVTGAALRAALAGERATGVIGVPRLYEALLSGIDDTVSQRGLPARRAFLAAVSLAEAARRHLGWNLGGLVFAGLRRKLAPELRLLVSGGARLDPAVAWRLAALGFDVRSGYGLAETASVHTANVPGCDRLGSEGKPFQGGAVRIDAPDADGVGEIVLRGPNVFAGYLDPARNADAFTPDGWFRSGDLGRLDDGFLAVTGRARDVIALGGGKKIDPEDLEKRYAASPLIAELAVLERDGRLRALVRADAAAIAAAGFTRADGAVRAALGEVAQTRPSHERLAGFALTREPLPRTRLGKLRRFLLPDLYARAEAGAAGPESRRPTAAIDPALLGTPRRRAAWDLVRARYGTRLAGVDDYLALDLGVDSLEWLNLALALEGRLGIDLSGVGLGDVATVRALLDAVDGAPGARDGREPPAADAAPGAAAAWLGPAPRWLRGVASVLLALNRLLVRTCFPLRVAGLEHLPADGPCVIVCNHLSYLDAPVLAAALPRAVLRRTHWGAAENRLPFVRSLHALWVALRVFPLEEADPAVGLACARDALGRGEVMAMFPEAWRSPDGALQPFMPGIGYLVAGRDIPIVPACLSGTFEALPRHRRRPRRAPLAVRFGAPLKPAELAAAGTGETPPQRIAAALHDAVAALCAADRAAGQRSSSG